MVKKKADGEKVKKQPVSFSPHQWWLILFYRGIWVETLSGTVRRMMKEWYAMHDMLYQYRIEDETAPDTLYRLLEGMK